MDKPILVAIDSAWRGQVIHYLVDSGFKVIEASTYDDALQIVRTETLLGAIGVNTWLVSDKDEATELANLIVGKIPSVMLVHKGKGYGWIKLWRESTLLDYCGIPVGLDELSQRMKLVGMT